MEYRKVYYRIESRYLCGPGWQDEAAEAAFRKECQEIFQKAGWELHPGDSSRGICDTVTKGQQDLYLHPTVFSGIVQEDEIERISLALKDADTFSCCAVDCYDTYYDLTDEQYLSYLEAKREEIANEFMKQYKTKRRNLYITDPVKNVVAKHFCLHRICDKDGKNDLAKQFVSKTLAELIQDGHLVTAETKQGLGIRTATDSEYRDFSRQRDSHTQTPLSDPSDSDLQFG